MAGPTPRPTDFDGRLRQLRIDLNDRINRISGFDGTQLTRTVQKLKELVDGLVTQINGVFSGFVSAGGDITAGGNVSSTSGRGVFAAGVTSPAVYGTSLTYGGLYKVQYIHADGTMGYVSSSRRFKQDEEPAVIVDIRDIMRRFQIFTFRYIEAVANIGDAAAIEWGPMAEDVHAAGLYWLVEYDESGRPEGVRHERFAYLAIMDGQDKQLQIDELRRDVDALMGREGRL